MASSSKNKTTMAKRNRENKVREKQMRKAAKKAARQQETADGAADSIGPSADHADEETKAREIAEALQRLEQ